MEWINLNEGLGRVRNNKKLYKRMLTMFLSGGEFAALEEALAAGDMPKAAAAAHSIKGVTGNLSLTELYKISTELTDQLRKDVLDEQTVSRCREAYAETRKAVEQLIATMEV